jgi:tRNA modification GTPase
MQARRAEALRSGRLFQRVAEIETLIGGAIAAIEAVVDFSDEVGDLDRENVRGGLAEAAEKIEALLSGVPASRLIRNGLRIALVGRPNVGKSSLLNALLDADRAIVTDIPGTTRDTLEEVASVGGYPVVLTDTAGIRETDDPVEALGVQRSRAAIAQADFVCVVYEANVGINADDEALAASLDRDPVWVANKSDLGHAGGPGIPVSALTSEGVAPLRKWIVQAFQQSPEEPLANDRHEPELIAASEAIANAAKTLASESLPVDLACVDLYVALDRLGRITGRSAPDEVIQRVFAEFCIGK